MKIGGSVTMAGPAQASAMLNQGADVLSLVGGSLKITGQGSISMNLAGTIAGGGTFVVGTLGNPDIILNPFGTGRLMFGKAVSITVGNTAEASSTIAIDSLSFAKGLKIKDGNGAAAATLHDTVVDGALTVDLGSGNDTITLDGKTPEISTVLYGPVLIKGGEGNDTFRLAGVAAQSSLKTWKSVVLDGGAWRR